MEKNKKFSVLSKVSNLLKVIGWVMIVAGFIYASFRGFLEPSLPHHSFGIDDMFQLVLGLAIGFFGLLTVAFSGIIDVLFAIEDNTNIRSE